jgi:hypothetical protein
MTPALSVTTADFENQLREFSLHPAAMTLDKKIDEMRRMEGRCLELFCCATLFNLDNARLRGFSEAVIWQEPFGDPENMR